jgi:beta-lactamase class A
MKPILLSRRSFVAGASLGAALAGRASAAAPQDQPFAAIEAGLSVVGRVGVAAVDTGSGAALLYRADERFAMCSTFKWALAAAILTKVDRGELKLAAQVPFTEADILPHAPVVAPRAAQGALSIEVLCQAIVDVSDNTAANLLLSLIGGPEGLTAFFRKQGDAVTRLDRIEPFLNQNLDRDPRDTTTPRAMVGLMRDILLGEALSAPSRERLLGWMKASQSGLDLLRRGLPRGWVVADKTGRSANGAVNDVAVVWPPGRAPLLIAAYVDDYKSRPALHRAAHVEIAGIVSRAFAERA